MDFSVIDRGGVMLIEPTNRIARAHLVSHTDPDANWLGDSLVVDPDFMPNLVSELEDKGFIVN
jgi:hypothetical protein